MDAFVVGLVILVLVCTVALFIFFAKAYICQIRFFRHLKTSDYKQWRSLRSLGDGKFVGAANFDKLRAYLKSNTGEEDLKVLRFKDELRFCFRMLKIIGLSIVVDVAVIFVCTVF
jgi:hypothetical protein